MYGICQLAAADALNKDDAAALVQTLFEKASKKESTPQPPAVVQVN
jgi:hypothetical protein